MKRNKLTNLILTCSVLSVFCFGLTTELAAAASAPARILPLGNSITAGAEQHGSYRRLLWQKLALAGIAADFVGTLSNHFDVNILNPDYDPDHEGHAGFTADELLGGLPGWLGLYTPDVCLLHAGHNDMFAAQDIASTLNELGQIIDALRTDNPNVVVLLAKIIPTGEAASNQRITDLNAQLDGFADAKSTPESPVIVVDQNTGFSAADDLYDGIHPNAVGVEKMVQKWLEALLPVVSGTQAPRPPVVQVEPGNQRVLLRWSAPLSATAYNVKRSTTSGGPYTGLVTNLMANAYIDLGLLNGTNYYYVVTAVNSHGEGTNSTERSATPGPDPVPIVKLAFEETSGLTTTNTGSAAGLLTLTTPFPERTDIVPANVGGLRAIDMGASTGDYGVDSAAPIPSLGGLTNFTITGWVNNRDAAQGGGGNRLVTWLGLDTNGVELVYRSDGSLMLSVNEEPTTARSSAGMIPADFGASPDNWRYFAVTYDAMVGRVQFYFGSNAGDAVLDKAVDYTGQGAVGTASGRLTVGHLNPERRIGLENRIFRGLIDEVQIFDKVLFLSEILTLQRGGTSPPLPPSPPVAIFTGTPTSGTVPLMVTFTDCSTGSITNRFWNFGDGTSTNITVTNVTHTYDAVGTNSVTLTVSGPGGSNTWTRVAYVGVTNAPLSTPMANFKGTPTNGAAPLLVTFTDTSTGSISNRFWDFGDGTTTNTTVTNVTHTYTMSGTNTVTLRVSGVDGSNTLALVAYVVVTNAASGPVPIVKLPFNEGSGTTTTNVGSAGGVLSLSTPQPVWSSNVPTNTGGASSIQMGATSGNYGVESAAPISALQGLDRFTITGWVNNRNVAQGSGGNRIVACTDKGGPGIDLAYKGDGSLVLGVNQYPDGVARSSSAKIPTDYNAGAANWRFFAVTYDSTVSEVKFYFGSNGSDAALDVAKVYGQGSIGMNIGRLCIGNLNTATRGSDASRKFRGLIDDVQIHGTVLSLAEIVAAQRSGATSPPPPEPPVASFSGTPANGAAPLLVTFTDSSTGAITNRFWSFGNGTTTNTTATNVLRTYSAAGTNTVTLTVFGPGGSNVLTRVAYIVVTNGPPPPPPVANFTGTPTNGAAPLAVTFTDNSTGSITNRFWMFGDGTTTNTTATNVLRTYSAAGTNTVTLTVFGPGGSNVLTRVAYIVVTNGPPQPPPVANFTGTPTNGAAPLAVTFTDNSTGSITNRFWMFGDGTTTNTTATNVLRTYSAAGTNTVTLTVFGPGGSNTLIRTAYVVVTNAVSGPGPIVKLPFNEGGGTTTTNVGSAGGVLSLSTPQPVWSSNVPTNTGGASSIHMGATSGNYGVESAAPISALQGLARFTITGWVNNRDIAQGSGGNRIVSCTDKGGPGIDLAYKSDGSLVLGVNQYPDGVARSSSAKVPTDYNAGAANWRFFAVTYDSTLNQVRFYFGSNGSDAALDVAKAYGQGSVGMNIGRLCIGNINTATRGTDGSRKFRGLIDDVQIHGTVLSPAEIVAAQRGTTPPIQLTSPGKPVVVLDSETVEPAMNVLPITAPRIMGVAWDGGRVRMQISGAAGQTCRVLASATLEEWVPIGTNTFGFDGTFEFIDDTSAGLPARFYRVSTP